MNNLADAVVWPECSGETASAITAFLENWNPYSIQSRRYSIFRLFRELIDPAWQELLVRFPISNASMLGAWTKYQFYRFREDVVARGDTVVSTNSYYTSWQELREFDSVALIAQRFGFEALERFIYFLIRFAEEDRTLRASLDSLRELARLCATKGAKRRKREGLDELRGEDVCRLCEKPTELRAYLKPFGKTSSSQVRDSNLRLRLSAHYCEAHRPREAFSNKVQSTYLKAKRNQNAFEKELSRLGWQSWGDPETANAKSGDPLVDEFIRLLSKHQILTCAQTPLDQQDTLEEKIRAEARALVDSRISDRKKEIVALLSTGINQTEVAKRLGLERQAISKALQSIKPKYRLDLHTSDGSHHLNPHDLSTTLQTY